MPQSSTTPFSGIFVSYRRDDSAGHAGRLFDKLIDHFGKDRIFMDIDTIEPGEDFVTVIENAVGSCEILLAIIGRDWLSEPGETTRRLDNPNDFVRLEIATALRRDIRVIPVLVQRASMPSPQDLPDDLAKFSRRNAVELADLRWQSDVAQLISVMDRVLAKREEAARLAEAAKQEEAERQRGEAEQRLLQQFEEAKQRQAEELRLAEEETKRRVAEDLRRQEEETKHREAEDRSKQEAAEPSRRRAVEQPAQTQGQEPAVADERQATVEQAVHASRDKRKAEPEPPASPTAPISDVTAALPPPANRQQRTTRLIVIACLAVLLGSVVTVMIITRRSEKVVTALPHAAKSDVTNNLGMKFMAISPGSFMMGSTNGAGGHRVTINYSFHMGKHEVTQAQWQTVMGSNPSYFTSYFKGCGDCPVEQVSWDDAQKFIQKLNEMNDGYTYRLPTEAEWEYACRAGTTGDYPGNLGEMAWYLENSGSKTQVVGAKQPNAWGLTDMHGNVWEWCQDWYHETYDGAPNDGSASLTRSTPPYRVLRGGSWHNTAAYLRIDPRDSGFPGGLSRNIGFRVVTVVRTQ